ncbi:MAG: ABC transporter substrate-binding protein [Mycobacteriales bacterium]
MTRTQGNNRAVTDGRVSPDGYELVFEDVPRLIDGFRRMVRGLEYDVCEMAATTYLCAREHGVRFTALPVFLVRGFHHAAIHRAAEGGVRDPKELEGKAVGVNRGYTVTTGVWARGVLADEYGVDLGAVTWVLSGDEHVADYVPPGNVVSMRPGGDLAEMVVAGELAAAIGVDGGHPGLAPLIPDAAEAGYDALRVRGHYPVNHLVVVRDELLAEHPDLAGALFDAFAEAKNRYVDQLRRDAIAEPTPADRMYRQVMDITGSDPLPYGLPPNRAVLEELIRQAMSQRILTLEPDVESLFAPATTTRTA